MCLKTMKQWSKWSLKVGVLQWDMFPGLTELLLTVCLIEFIWIPKSKSNTNQFADILTQRNFTRDEWNHLLCLFKIHFSSTSCSDTMAKRSQQDSGEERVTAKSRPMMNLIARTPSFVSSSTSVRPGKKHYGSQDPSKSVAGEDRSGRPDKGTDYLKPLIITSLSSSWSASLQQIIQNWMMTVLGLLKSGKLRWFSLILLHERIRRRIWWCNFSTLIHFVSETAIVSFHTLPVGFPLPTVSKNSLHTLFCSLILGQGVLLNSSIYAPKILISNEILPRYFFSP